MIIKSIKWQIHLWHALLLSCILCILLTWVYLQKEKTIHKEIEVELASYTNTILPKIFGRKRTQLLNRNNNSNDSIANRSNNSQIGSSNEGLPTLRNAPRPGRFLPLDTQTIDEEVKKGKYFIVLNKTKGLVYESENSPGITDDRLTTIIDKADRSILDYPEWVNGNVHYVHNTPGPMILISGLRSTNIDEQLMEFKVKLICIGGFLMIIGCIGGWLTVGYAIAPMKKISRAAQQIAEGNTDERIDIGKTQSEIGEMAITLNKSFDMLNNQVQQQARFTADVSHDLRTPVSIITSTCQYALAADRTNEKYQQALNECLNVSIHMGDLVQSLMEVARNTSESLVLHEEFVDLESLINECLTYLKKKAADKNIELICECEELDFFADPIRLKQIFINIISNGINYTDEGNITVKCKESGDNIIITISDTGKGINKKDLPHMFERFYRAESSRKNSNKHSGLGLAITKDLVEAHHGAIKVESTPGKGTRFTITLPSNVKIIE